MSPQVKEVAVKLLGLPASSRALLAEKLIASLDDTEDSNVEALWLEEADRRAHEIAENKVAGRSAKKVFREARKKLK